MEAFIGGTAGYGATKVAMNKTLEQIGGKVALGLMMGGGKKRSKKRSKKHSKKLSLKHSVKNYL